MINRGSVVWEGSCPCDMIWYYELWYDDMTDDEMILYDIIITINYYYYYNYYVNIINPDYDIIMLWYGLWVMNEIIYIL